MLQENSDRFKGLQSALFMAEVLKEREAQMDVKDNVKMQEGERDDAWHQQLLENNQEYDRKQNDKGEILAKTKVEFQEAQKKQMQLNHKLKRADQKQEMAEGKEIQRVAIKAIEKEKAAELRRKDMAKNLADETMASNKEQERIKKKMQQELEAEEKALEEYAKQKEAEIERRKKREGDKFAKTQLERQKMIDSQAA